MAISLKIVINLSRTYEKTISEKRLAIFFGTDRLTYIQLLLYRDIQSIHILGDKENLMYVVEVIFILQYLSKTSYIAQKA